MSTISHATALSGQRFPQSEAAAAIGTADRAVLAYRPLDWRVVTLSLAPFLPLSYTLCVIHCLIFPGMVQYFRAWSAFLPGFTWLSWGSFFLGFAETIVYGVYIGLVFTLLYNLFARMFHARR